MSPRTSAQNQALRDATRTRILDAALRLFAEYGYAGASIRRIAEAAEMAPGLLYSHFRGKPEVLRAIYARSMDDVYASLRAAEGEAGGPPLARLIRSAFDILRGNLDFWKLTYGVRMQGAALRDLGPALEAWTSRIMAALEAHFRAAGSRRSRAEAAVLFAAIDGMGQHYALDPEHYPLDAAVEALIDRYAGSRLRRSEAGAGGPPPRLRRAEPDAATARGGAEGPADKPTASRIPQASPTSNRKAGSHGSASRKSSASGDQDSSRNARTGNDPASRPGPRIRGNGRGRRR